MTALERTAENIPSPITGRQNVQLERELDVRTIISLYKRAWNVDVTHCFQGMETVYVYRCLDTGYQFFYPFFVAGNADFYEAVQKQEGYYMDWKWEHQEALKEIRTADRVLEVGCGKGSFLKKISEEVHADCTGLEINEGAIRLGRKGGVTILHETLHEHSSKHAGLYDVVCAFQVLEHIWDVRGFLLSSIEALKRGGKLIIGVPNNDSYLKYQSYAFTNMPPHHMGLWNEKSLRSLDGLFPITLEKIACEPLQRMHFSGYVAATLERFLHPHRKPFKYVFHILDYLCLVLLLPVRLNIKGHTILSVYSKV